MMLDMETEVRAWLPVGRRVYACNLASGHIDQRVPLMLAAESKRFFISFCYQQVIIICLHFPAELGFIYKEDRKKKG
jgi:hypothetical protein